MMNACDLGFGFILGQLGVEDSHQPRSAHRLKNTAMNLSSRNVKSVFNPCFIYGYRPARFLLWRGWFTSFLLRHRLGIAGLPVGYDTSRSSMLCRAWGGGGPNVASHANGGPEEWINGMETDRNGMVEALMEGEWIKKGPGDMDGMESGWNGWKWNMERRRLDNRERR